MAIVINDGGSSFIIIKHCPWGGKKLPESKRNLWFDKLAESGYNDPVNQNIPKEFKTNEWYKQ